MNPSADVRLALRHLKLTKAEYDILRKLPSPFCIAKTCYSHCDRYDSDDIVCPPFEQQRFVPQRLIAMLDFKKAKERALLAHRYPEEAIFTCAYIELLEDLFKHMLTMSLPVMLQQHRVIDFKPQLRRRSENESTVRFTREELELRRKQAKISHAYRKYRRR